MSVDVRASGAGRPAPAARADRPGLPLQLTVRGDVVTADGLLVAETVGSVLEAVGGLIELGWSEVTLDVAGVQAVDAAAAAALAAAQAQPARTGARLRIQVPYASTGSMFPGCVIDAPAQYGLPGPGAPVDGMVPS